MPRPLASPLALVLGALSLIACMCGGPSDPTTTVDPVDLAPELGVGMPDAVQGAPPTAAGGWSASIRGVCEMERDCGCLEKESVDACEASLNKSATAFDAGVLTCIVTQGCASMCGGGGVRCIEEGYQRMSAEEAAAHQMRMGIINNFPDGSCPPGTVRRVSSSGQFLGCQ